MGQGRLDVTGNSEEIRRAACDLVSKLQEGDEFIGVSLPVFWLPNNIGTNGGFLTQCRNAAARGAIVRRVFLIDERLLDKHLRAIVSTQLSSVASLDPVSRSRFAVRYRLLSSEQRRAQVAAGRHFGLLVKEGATTSMSPVYDGDDNLVTLRFRSGARHVDGLREIFEDLWSKAMPLADLRLQNSAVDVDVLATSAAPLCAQAPAV